MHNRRQFLKGAAVGGAALLAAPTLLKGAIIPAKTTTTKQLDTVLLDEIPNPQEVLEGIRKTKQECFDRWSKVFKFGNLTQDNALELAVSLENQRLINEEHADHYSVAQFKRISIPMVYRGFHDGVLKELVSVQTLLGPCGCVFWIDKDDRLHGTEIIAKTRRYLKAVYNLDTEAELTAILCSETALEADREVVTDLRNNAPRFVCRSNGFASFIQGRLDEITRNTAKSYPGHRPEEGYSVHIVGGSYQKKLSQWVVASPNVCNELQKHKDFKPYDNWLTFGITAIGHIGNFKIYKDHLFPVNQALAGCKYGHYKAGYVFSDYVPWTQTSLDPETFCPGKGLLRRYGKRLINRNMYANVVFEKLA